MNTTRVKRTGFGLLTAITSFDFVCTGAAWEKRTEITRNLSERRQSFEDRLLDYSDAEFRRLFRMNRHSFDLLFAKLEPMLQTSPHHRSISPKEKLLVTLYFLGGGFCSIAHFQRITSPQAELSTTLHTPSI